MDALARTCEDFLYGFDPWAEVPMAAAEALSEGLLSPSLIDLACLRHGDNVEIRALIPQVFGELGRVLPSLPAAAFARAKQIARQCLDSCLPLDAGLTQIIRFLMEEESCGDTYCHGYGDILLFQEWHHALNCPRCQAAGTVPYHFRDDDAAIAELLGFLRVLAVSDHECD